MTTYFGFALADSMFTGNCQISRVELGIVSAKVVVRDAVACLNPSHAATIAAMRERFGIEIAIPESPPKVSLGSGDAILVMGVRGLPRLTDRHEYTHAEIESATFSFALYRIDAE